MLDDVIALLEALGVSGAGGDPLIPYMINSVTERVKNETNQDTIPDGLHYVAVELVVGEYNWTLTAWIWKRRLNRFRKAIPTRFLPLVMGA